MAMGGLAYIGFSFSFLSVAAPEKIRKNVSNFMSFSYYYYSSLRMANKRLV